jgi:hypothetical protein
MKTKTMAMFAVLMIALSAAGFAYAHWSDTVQIEGIVHMGDLVVGWYNTTDYLLDWNETTNGVPEEDFDPPKPWVCNATITLQDPETGVHHKPPETVYKTMNITVGNAYPQWDLHIRAYIKNAGTIPAYVCPDFEIDMYDEKDKEDLLFVYNETTGEGEIWDNGDNDVWDTPLGSVDDVVIINFYVTTDLQGWQLHPCTANPFEIDVDFKQEAEECHTYTFTIKITAVQWNKDYECAQIP